MVYHYFSFSFGFLCILFHLIIKNLINLGFFKNWTLALALHFELRFIIWLLAKWLLYQHDTIICCAGKTTSVMIVPKQSASLYLLSQPKVRYAQGNSMVRRYPSLKKGFIKEDVWKIGELHSFITASVLMGIWSK